jgi:PST family polysaccharide transporter
VETDTTNIQVPLNNSEQITSTAARSFSWNLAGSIIRSGSSFLIGVVLARLLGPEPFGLVALAMVVISIGNLTIDSGLSAVLVQKKNISDRDISYIFTIQMTLGLGIAAFLILSAQALSQALKQPAVIPIIRVLSLQLILQSASQTATSLLKRRMAFKKIQQAQIVSYLTGYLILGIPLALLHWGVWSLVIAQLFQSLIYLVMVYNWTRHTLRINFKDNEALIGFGIKVLGINMASWVIMNLDNMLVGRNFGPTNLGFYSRALTLALTPVGLFVSAAQSVLFSASARMQEKLDDVRQIFLKIVVILAFVFFPFAFFEAGIAKELVVFIYGINWAPAAPLLIPLAISASFYTLMAIEGPLLTGIGKPQQEMKMQILTAVVGSILMIIGAQISIIALAWAVFSVYVLRFILVSIVTFKSFQISLRDIIKPIIFSLATASVIFASIVFIRQYIQNLHIALQIGIDTIMSLGLWILMFFLGNKTILHTDFIEILNLSVGKLFGSHRYVRS